MIISFSRTTPALLAGHKTVTRRDWKHEHAEKFKAGMIVDAWNTSPRNVKLNPRRVARIELVADPVLERTDKAPSEDWIEEGFEFMQARGLKLENDLSPRELWQEWMMSTHYLWVVRFKLIEVIA